jgi:hypothetical protein
LKKSRKEVKIPFKISFFKVACKSISKQNYLVDSNKLTSVGLRRWEERRSISAFGRNGNQKISKLLKMKNYRC